MQAGPLPVQARNNLESARLFQAMGGYAGGAQLRQNDFTVADDIGQSCGNDAVRYFLCGKEFLASGTPDVDAAGVDDKQPRVHICQFPADGIKGQLVVGGDKHRRLFGGIADTVYSGDYLVVVAAESDANTGCAERVPKGQFRTYSGDRADRCLLEVNDIWFKRVSRSVEAPDTGGGLGASTRCVVLNRRRGYLFDRRCHVERLKCIFSLFFLHVFSMFFCMGRVKRTAVSDRRRELFFVSLRCLRIVRTESIV